MSDLKKINYSVDLIQKNIELETLNMLDAWEDGREYDIPHYTISFKGKSVDIPLDFADVNNEIQEHLQTLMEIFEDY